MRRILVQTGIFIGRIIDFFYPPFRRYFSLQFFRYGVCGAANVVFDWVLYFVTYNYILCKTDVSLGIVTLSPHIAALFITFPVTLLTGFLLQKYVTFTASQLRGRQQLFRYMLVVAVNLLINYFGLKFLIEVLHFYPTPSKMLVTLVCTIFSYFMQKMFTFKVREENNKR